jgi:hypothetical protein
MFRVGVSFYTTLQKKSVNKLSYTVNCLEQKAFAWAPLFLYGWHHGLNMELDLQSLYGLHVT